VLRGLGGLGWGGECGGVTVSVFSVLCEGRVAQWWGWVGWSFHLAPRTHAWPPAGWGLCGARGRVTDGVGLSGESRKRFSRDEEHSGGDNADGRSVVFAGMCGVVWVGGHRSGVRLVVLWDLLVVGVGVGCCWGGVAAKAKRE